VYFCVIEHENLPKDVSGVIENLTQYKFFLAAAKNGSISAAARKLYVTQPAVSSGILQLEDALGVKLFFRTSRGITLTPEGKILYDYVNSGLSFIEAGEDKLREISGLNSGIMRIGASDMTLKFFLLKYIEEFNNIYPNINLIMENNPTPQTLNSLKNGQIDFCMVSEPVDEDSDIKFIPVFEIRDIIVCKNNEKFAALFDREIDIEELCVYTLIMLEKETSTRRYWEKFITIEPSIELAQSDLIIDFALRGLGISFIVENFAIEYLKSGELKEIKLKTQIPKRRFLLGYLNNIPLSAAAKKFISKITN